MTLRWLRLELRRRWRSLVVLALLVAFASATVLASVAGARRGDTAVDRLLAATLPATAVVLPNEPGFDWSQVRALPNVEAVGTFAGVGPFVDGVPVSALWFPPTDAETMRTVERPVVLDGRLANPRRVDEVVVTSRFPEKYGKGVGDTVVIRLLTPREMDSFTSESTDETPKSGPVIRARIVGVVRSGVFSEGMGDEAALIPSPALFTRYRANMMGTQDAVLVNAIVRLRGGEAALPKFRKDLAEVSGRAGFDIWNRADEARHARKVHGFEAIALLTFGLVALAAAMVLVGQAVTRYTAATVANLGALRAVGITRRQTMVAASAAPVLAALVGGTLGVAVAVVVSRWMPIGAAALVEPDPGIDVDWLVLGAGWVLAPLAVLAASSGTVWLARGTSRLSPRSSTVAAAAARGGLPVPLVAGARFALEPGRGAVPVRPALFGAVTGVLGLLAAFTFSAGVSDAVGNPERFGQAHQLHGWLGVDGRDFGDSGETVRSMATDEDVLAVNDAKVAVAESGSTSVVVYTYEPVDEPLPVVLAEGTMPASADEVVLAPTSAGRLGAEVGSTVRLTGNDGTHPMRVSGIGFVPHGWQNDYHEGGWLSPAGYDRLFSGFGFHVVQVALHPGADAQAVAARLQESSRLPTGDYAIGLEPVEVPRQVAEIRGVRVLPMVLGGFLALLAVASVGHALATAVRRRRYEIAVMRALGMTRGQSRLLVMTQATVLAGVGLVFGVPLGMALGRTLWRLVADYTPLYYQPPVASWVLVLVAPVAIVLANLLAAGPGRRAARLRVGHVLRTE